MLYCLMKNKTQVDKDLCALRSENKIIRFPFRSSSSSDYIMLFKDYISILKEHLQAHNISTVKVINTLKNETDLIYFSKVELRGKFCLSDDAINKLTQEKILLLNSDAKYEFSVPCSGKFIELLNQGKMRITSILNNRPSCEILERELLEMKLKQCTLGIKFLLYDMIGKGQVKIVKCGMGNLIRLTKRN